MKKLDLILYTVMLVMGAAGLVSFAVLAFHGQVAGMRIVAMLLSVALTAVGALGLVSYHRAAQEARRRAARKKKSKE